MKEISMYDPSVNLSLSASTQLISCATKLRFEYVGVTVFGTLLYFDLMTILLPGVEQFI